MERVDEAADLLGKGVATIWRRIRDDKIIVVRIAGRTLIPKRILDFLNILEKWSQGSKCPGCLPGGGSPSCPIRTCSQQRGFLTCAECDRMPCNSLELVTKRYSNWNMRNLERIKEVGYRQFVDQMQEKVRNGFLTSDVISSEMVVTEMMKLKSVSQGDLGEEDTACTDWPGPPEEK